MPDGIASELIPKVLELPPFEALRFSQEKLKALLERPEYKNSTIVEKFQRQLDSNEFEGMMLTAFTDIDGTFISVLWPTDSEKQNLPPSALKMIYEEINSPRIKATEEITEFLYRHNIPIIAVTGRDIPMVEELNQIGITPKFDMIAGAVGTELDVLQKDNIYKRDAKFETHVREEIGFERSRVYAMCCEVKEDIRTRMPHLDLVFQDRDSEENVRIYAENPLAKEQGRTKINSPQPYKISFNLNGTLSEMEAVRQTFLKEFVKNGLEKVKLVFSHTEDLQGGRIRFNIDVVPVQKDEAINWMCGEYGCVGAVAGDSGNDEAMIKFGAEAGVVVGGSKQELITAIDMVSKNPLRRTKHFAVYTIDGQNRLLYIEPGGVFGPESLKKAGRAFLLLLKLRSK